jgi:hypothetical protein
MIFTNRNAYKITVLNIYINSAYNTNLQIFHPKLDIPVRESQCSGRQRASVPEGNGLVCFCLIAFYERGIVLSSPCRICGAEAGFTRLIHREYTSCGKSKVDYGWLSPTGQVAQRYPDYSVKHFEKNALIDLAI